MIDSLLTVSKNYCHSSTVLQYSMVWSTSVLQYSVVYSTTVQRGVQYYSTAWCAVLQYSVVCSDLEYCDYSQYL